MSALTPAGAYASAYCDEQAARALKFLRFSSSDRGERNGESCRARAGREGAAACRGALEETLCKFYGQATKGAWWMPWQKKAMKDVASCDKPRRAASRL
jgi:hypothetical protein